jgi:hypothetical protein
MGTLPEAREGASVEEDLVSAPASVDRLRFVGEMGPSTLEDC